MSIIGPGALTEYGGGGRTGRRRGTVYVNEPATGFFIAGSSLKKLNGIYIRANPSRVVSRRRCALAYEHEGGGGWSMVLTESRDDEYEWQFLAPGDRRAVLRHDGETLIPGAGKRWEHVSSFESDDENDSDSSESEHENETQVIKTENKSIEDLEDELPWQVIALLDVSITRDLLYSKKYRDNKVTRSKRGADLPQLNPNSPLALARAETQTPVSELYWLYVVRVDSVEIGDFRLAARGDYLKINRVDNTFLYTTEGEAVAASACSQVNIAPVSENGLELDDEQENLFDKPFEPRLQVDSEDVVITEDESDTENSFEEPSSSDTSIFSWCGDAQSGRIAKGDTITGKEAWLLRRGARPEKCTVLGNPSMNDDQVPISLNSKQVLIDLRCLQLTVHPVEAAVLGVDVNDKKNFTKDGLMAALRAAERDAAYELRLGAANAKTERKKSLFIDAYNALKDKVYPVQASTQKKNPLEAVALGSTGRRAATAARNLMSTLSKQESCQEIKRALAILKQVVSDESSRQDNDPNDLCRLRLAVAFAGLGPRCLEEANAQQALTVRPEDAAANVMLALYTFRRGKRDEAATLLKKALDLGPLAGFDAAWAQETAARLLRQISRAQRSKNKADDAYRRGNLVQANEHYSKAIEEISEDTHDTWLLATLLANRAACRRRLRLLPEALTDVDKALALFPGYTKAVFRKAVLLLEAGKPQAAKRCFLEVLRLQREWPQLAQWLTRCIALHRRSKKKQSYQGWDDSGDDESDHDEQVDNTRAEEAPISDHNLEHISNPDIEIDHYTVLGVDADASAAQVKRAYRMRSLKYHPDKKNGSTIAFQRVAEAFDTLSNPEKRREYDLGGDLNRTKNNSQSDDDSDEQQERSLYEQVERKFFPERYEFYPFGDPFVEKRKMRARRAKERDFSSSPFGDQRNHTYNNWWEPS